MWSRLQRELEERNAPGRLGTNGEVNAFFTEEQAAVQRGSVFGQEIRGEGVGGCCWQEVVENCKSRNSGRHGWWRRFALPAHMCAQPISGGIGPLSIRQTCYSFSPLFPNTYFCLEAVFGVAETAGLEEKADLFEAHCCSTANIFGKVL